MKELKASTKAGQNIIAKASRYCGTELTDVYDRISAYKERAYRWCMEEFNKTDDAWAFHICSYNTFAFTCRWQGTKDGENILRYETKDNSYLVWLDR